MVQILTAKAAGGPAPAVEAARGTRIAAKVPAVPQTRAMRAKPGIQASLAAGEGGGGSTMAQSVMVSPSPTLMDTLARGSVGRGGEGAGAVCHTVTDVRMAGNGNRTRRAVMEARRWPVQHVSVGGEMQPSTTVREPLRGMDGEQMRSELAAHGAD
jgi:hypothetical protein